MTIQTGKQTNEDEDAPPQGDLDSSSILRGALLGVILAVCLVAGYFLKRMAEPSQSSGSSAHAATTSTSGTASINEPPSIPPTPPYPLRKCHEWMKEAGDDAGNRDDALIAATRAQACYLSHIAQPAPLIKPSGI